MFLFPFEVSAAPQSQAGGGRIIVVLDAEPNDVQAFQFSVSGASPVAFTLDDDGGSDNAYTDQQVFSGLSAGIYSITQNVPSGWLLTSVSTSGIANSSISFGGDSSFDAGDQSVAMNLAANEEVVLTFNNVRKDCDYGSFLVNNRLTSTGRAVDGSIVPTLSTSAQLLVDACRYDFGDLPDDSTSTGSPISPGYSTDYIGIAGPRHTIVEGLRLGLVVDDEESGRPDANATGDDAHQSDDEESFNPAAVSLVAGSPANLEVSVLNSTAHEAYLAGFIDFNGDGDFSDADESVIVTVNRSNEQQVVPLRVNVPLTATVNQQIGLRLRLNSESNIGANGSGQYGEVEDYLVLVNPVVYLGNQVWKDLNNNGMLDSGETGIDNVKIDLYRDTDGDGLFTPGDSFVATTQTANGGFYSFANLAPSLTPADNYFVVVPETNFLINEPLFSYVSSTPTEVDSNTDRDGDDNGLPAGVPGAITSGYISLRGGTEPFTTSSAGDSNWTVDFGFYLPSTVGDSVWFDENGDGIQAGESGIANVELILTSTSGITATTTTDANGSYQFANLVPGVYTLAVNPASVPNGYRPTTVETISVTLNEGIYFSDGDFGYDTISFNSSIGNVVWHDSDSDGLRGTEPGIANVTLLLTTASGNTLTTTTDANGFYTFSNLVPGDYTVSVDTTTIPAIYQATTAESFTLTLSENQHYAEANFGFFEPVVEQELVPSLIVEKLTNGHEDKGGNPLVVGIGEAITWTYVITNTGNVTLTNLTLADDIEGSVNCPLLILGPGESMTCHHFGTAREGEYVNEALVTAIAATEQMTPVSAADTSRYVGVGLTLGNLVWHDVNNNGLYEPNLGEKGLANVEVQLYLAGDTPGFHSPILQTRTNERGHYTFTNLAVAEYIVYLPSAPILQPVSSTVDDPSDNQEDNDDNGLQDNFSGPVRSPIVQLALHTESVHDGDGSQGELTIDFGFFAPPIAIGDRVWFDTNLDGLQTAGEPGVPGVTVTLYEVGVADPIATKVTDEAGNYLFVNLALGSYYVVFDLKTLPQGTIPTAINQGGESVDSDVDPKTGATDILTILTPDVLHLDLDMGIAPMSSIGDRVWYDANRNGIQDVGESGVSGIEVELYDANLTLVKTTRTDGRGRYLFEDLAPGDYSLKVNVPTEYALSPANVGTKEAADSDSDSSGRTPATRLDPNEHDPSWDVGIYLATDNPAALGDKVWYDSNRNGIQDAGESGIPGVSVKLFNSGGVEVAETITDKDGLYGFDNLLAGNYQLQFVPPAGYEPSPANIGTNESTAEWMDSDIDPASLRTPMITLTPGMNDIRWDAGFFTPQPPASIGDFVWFDLNLNGIQDESETGIPGVSVTLLDGNGQPLAETTTDSNGFYIFENLSAGNYALHFEPALSLYVPSVADAGVDDTLDSDMNTLTRRTPATSLGAGENDMSWDAGFNLGISEGSLQSSLPATIGDRIWIDTNRDGLQNDDPELVPVVTVNLFTASGQLVASVTTDNSGRYLFNNLVPGDYYLEFIVPETYEITQQSLNREINSEIDNDVDPESGQTVVVSVNAGLPYVALDLGLYAVRPTSLETTDEPDKIGNDHTLFLPFVRLRSGITSADLKKDSEKEPSSLSIEPEALETFDLGEYESSQTDTVVTPELAPEALETFDLGEMQPPVHEDELTDVDSLFELPPPALETFDLGEIDGDSEPAGETPLNESEYLAPDAYETFDLGEAQPSVTDHAETSTGSLDELPPALETFDLGGVESDPGQVGEDPLDEPGELAPEALETFDLGEVQPFVTDHAETSTGSLDELPPALETFDLGGVESDPGQVGEDPRNEPGELAPEALETFDLGEVQPSADDNAKTNAENSEQLPPQALETFGMGKVDDTRSVDSLQSNVGVDGEFEPGFLETFDLDSEPQASQLIFLPIVRSRAGGIKRPLSPSVEPPARNSLVIFVLDGKEVVYTVVPTGMVDLGIPYWSEFE